MKEQAYTRKKTFDELTSGMAGGELICHYQPQFDATTLRLSGMEALVRWQRKSGELILPQKFLGVADDMGILSEIDGLVLRRVLRDIEAWKRAGISVPPVSVNVSSSRLNDPRFGVQLKALSIPEGMIAFELVESAFLDTKDSVVDENLRIARSLGISIEIDDFGTGHASITGLLEIAPQRLKIDRSLIGPITTSNQQRELVKNILGIGHVLGIKVVAEGVETAAHTEILQAMRCDVLQGFGLSRPMDPASTGQFLAASSHAPVALVK
jgi:EAL domain-containing protein (putative c-di-GMP-specific phosphodiesterase class I)